MATAQELLALAAQNVGVDPTTLRAMGSPAPAPPATPGAAPAPTFVQGAQQAATAAGIPVNVPQAAQFGASLANPPPSTDPGWFATHPEMRRLVNDAKKFTGLGNLIPDIPGASSPAQPASAPAAAPQGTAPNGAAPAGGRIAVPEVTVTGAPPARAPSGSGGGSNLQRKVDDATAAELEGITREAKSQYGLSALKERREAAEAQMLGVAAEEQRAGIVRQQQRDAMAEQRATEFLAASQRMSEDLAKTHIDPQRLWHNTDDGSKAMFAIGAALGGALQGMGVASGNSTLDIMQKLVDRDVSAQEKNYEIGANALHQRNTVFSQFMQVSGDARLAATQTRIALYDNTLNEINAQSKQLGTAETMQNGKIAAQVILQKKLELERQLAVQARDTAARQAAAAAAQAAARDKEMFERSYKLAELEYNYAKLTHEKKGSGAASDKELNKETAELGQRLSASPLIQAETNVENLYAQIPKDPKTNRPDVSKFQGFEGIGAGADMREKFAPPLSKMGPLDLAAHAASLVVPGSGVAYRAAQLEPGERTNRQDWARVAAGIRHDITGAGMTDRERQELNDMIDDAKTPEAQANTIIKAYEMVKRSKATIRSGASDEARDEFDRRMKKETE